MNSEWPIQTHRRPFCTPKPDADLCMRVDLRWPKKLWKISTGLAGLRAAGPSRAVDRGPLGRWAVAGRGPRAAGPRACFQQNPPSLWWSKVDFC